jgi:hypothetical protein
MGLGKTYSTGYLLDSNNNSGAVGQVLSTTSTGVDWVDGSGSGIIGGPYLPLSAGSSYPLTGDLHINSLIKLASQITTKIELVTNQMTLYAGGLQILTGFNASNDGVVVGNTTGDMNITLAGGANEKILYLEGSSGNVGIGTTSPVSHSAARKTLIISDATDGANIEIWGNSGGKSILQSVNTDTYVGNLAGAGTTYILSGAAATAITALSGGNVGIGTTTPTGGKLVVAGNVFISGGGYLTWDGKSSYVTTVPGNAAGFIFSTSRNPNDGSGAFPFNNYGEMIFQGNPRSGYNGGFTWVTGQAAYSATVTPTPKMTLTTAGDLGIGTTLPGQKLHVIGKTISSVDLTVGNNSSGAVRYSGQNGYYSFITRSNYNDWSLSLLGTDGDASTDPIGTQLVTVNYSGNVGIGVTGPNANLQVERNSSTANLFDFFDIVANIGNLNSNPGNHYPSGIRIYQGSGTMGSGLAALNIGVDTNSAVTASVNTATLETPNGMTGGLRFTTRDTSAPIRFLTDSVERMRILGTGNVGIGTTGPGEKLTVISSTANTWATSIENTAANGTSFGLEIVAGSNNGDKALAVRNKSSSDLMVVRGDGNVGIGTASPSFQLSIENHATTTSVATLEIDGKRTDGNDGAVGELIFSNNGDTFATVVGVRDGADNKGSFQFQTQDSTFATRMTISSDGNVGIGVVNPETSRLLVRGSTNDSTSQIFQAANLAGNTRYAIRPDGDNKWYKSDSSLSMTITSAGNVGIGATSPGAKLEVAGEIRVADGNKAAPSYTFTSDTNTGMYSDIADQLKFAVGGDQKLRVTSTGITVTGTVTTTDLAVSGVASVDGGFTSNGGNTMNLLTITSNLTCQGNITVQDSDKILIGNSGDLELYHSGSQSYIKDVGTGDLNILADDLVIGNTAEDPYFTADDGGSSSMYADGIRIFSAVDDGAASMSYFGFGSATTSSGSGYGYKYGANNPGTTQGLCITTSDTGGAYFDGVAQFQNTSTSQGAGMFQMINFGSLYGRYMNFYRGSTSNIIGYIGYNGTNTSVTFSTTSSDIRTKKNIATWDENVLDKFKALQPKRFNFKAEKGDPGLEKERGFIAQYEKDNFPEVYQLNGPDDDAKYGFHPMEMVPYLMKAVKDLVIKTEELERRIKTLES